MNQGVAEFYYSKRVPERAIEIATITALPSTPADLVDVIETDHTNETIKAGALTVTGSNSGIVRTFNAKALGNSAAISGATQYFVRNQFFEITNVTLDGTITGAPLYYKHAIPPEVSDVTIVDFNGNEVTDYRVVSGFVYHSCDGSPYWIRFHANRLMQTELLQYAPVMRKASSLDATSFTFNHGVLKVASTATHHIRFTENNGYRLLPPHNVLPNDPWFARVRFTTNPPAPEWARQHFMPAMPFMLATWVPGKLVGPNVVEFERKQIMADPSRLPDILVFDKNYELKHAIDGSAPNTNQRKGYLYPWKRSLIAPNGVDFARARVHLLADVDADDIIFGFYFYAEPDVVFQDIDVNPFTNPAVRNRVIEFYYADRASDIPPRT